MHNREPKIVLVCSLSELASKRLRFRNQLTSGEFVTFLLLPCEYSQVITAPESQRSPPRFVGSIGIAYQLPGAFNGERANGLTSHLKAMGLFDSARIMSVKSSLLLFYAKPVIA
jgi:hypothetical protein